MRWAPSLLLGASLLLVTVLNETNIEFDWSSGTAIALIVLSGVMWVAFFEHGSGLCLTTYRV